MLIEKYGKSFAECLKTLHFSGRTCYAKCHAQKNSVWLKLSSSFRYCYILVSWGIFASKSRAIIHLKQWDLQQISFNWTGILKMRCRNIRLVRKFPELAHRLGSLRKCKLRDCPKGCFRGLELFGIFKEHRLLKKEEKASYCFAIFSC